MKEFWTSYAILSVLTVIVVAPAGDTGWEMLSLIGVFLPIPFLLIGRFHARFRWRFLTAFLAIVAGQFLAILGLPAVSALFGH